MAIGRGYITNAELTDMLVESEHREELLREENLKLQRDCDRLRAELAKVLRKNQLLRRPAVQRWFAGVK